MAYAVPGYYVTLENVFGTTGMVLRSIQLAPQVYKNWRNKSTKGLSQPMMLIWTTASSLFGIYAIILKLSIPLIIQPQIFIMMGLFTFMQYFYYDSPKFEGSKVKSGILLMLMTLLKVGVDVGSVYGIEVAKSRNVRWPENFLGILPLVLNFVGYLPQYITTYKEKRVTGISLIFIELDMAGDFFCILSLVFRPPPFDVIASLTYSLLFMLDSLIVFSYYFLNWYRASKESGIQNSIEEGTMLELGTKEGSIVLSTN